MISTAVKVGQKVTTSGFPGRIVRVCEWSRQPRDVMVEIRLATGTVCVSCHDLREVM